MKRILLTAAVLMLCSCSQGTSAPQTVTVVSSETTQSVTEAVTETETTAETTSDITTETASVTTETEYVPVYPDFEDTPENAYERLTISFRDGNGNETAPDDYAGAYSYFGKMYICITEKEPSSYYTTSPVSMNPLPVPSCRMSSGKFASSCQYFFIPLLIAILVASDFLTPRRVFAIFVLTSGLTLLLYCFSIYQTLSI